MSALALSVALVAALLAGAPAMSQQQRGVTIEATAAPAERLKLGDAYALVIGNNQYKHLPVLQTAVSDAAAVAELLRTKYDFADVTLLLNATRGDILRALARYRRQLEPTDRLLIYYAGHGLLDREAQQGYWLPVEAEEDVNVDWISNATITDALKAMLARHVMIVADSCYSGALTRNVDAAARAPAGADRLIWLARVADKRARTALVSGGLEPVVDGGRNGHSVFASAFLDVLRRNDGLLDGQSLFDRLKDQVVVNADQTPAYGNVRNAFHEGGDFIFVPRGATIRAAPPGARPAAQMAALPSPAASTFAVEERDETLTALKNANVRAEPATRGAKLTTLAKGSAVAVTGKVKDRDWLHVALADGRTGYIWARLLGEKPADAAPSPSPAPPPAKPADPFKVVLDSGLTLGDWTLLAEDRLQRGEGMAVLKEAAGHRERHGGFPALDDLLARGAAAELEVLTIRSEAEARAALPVLSRLDALVGPSLPLLEKQALAYHRLKAYEEAEAAYRAWIGKAPADHPERKRMALGLFNTRKGVALEPGWKAGQQFRDCAECPEMVVLPAGSFMMGSPESEPERDDDEGPQRRVTIQAPFAVGKYEVTWAEWRACVSARGCDQRPSNEGWGFGQRPVINVSWKDVKSFVAWLSQRTGHDYRLLSEAEWEYAARAGTATPFHTGLRITTDQANFDGSYTYNGSATGSDREQTVPVGSFAANAFGLHDMHGNVNEWVEDCYHDNYVGAPSDGSAWKTGSCEKRVLRGGCWLYQPRSLRSAIRFSSASVTRSRCNGFRVARTLSR